MLATSSSASSSAGSIGPAGFRAALVGAGDDVGDERGEEPAEAALIVGGRDQVQRVRAVE